MPLEAEVNAAQYALAVLVGEYPEKMVQELVDADPDPVHARPRGRREFRWIC